MNADCPVCNFPGIPVTGSIVKCPNCATQLKASISGIEIPTPLFVGVLSFAAGMLLGPAIIASTSGGQRWLQQQATRKFE